MLSSPLLRAQAPQAPSRTTPLGEIINADEFGDAAKDALPRAEFERIASGAESGRTLAKNRAFFERISFRPRMLVDVSRLGLETELFGEKMFAPILAGPTSRHQRADADSELAVLAMLEARAAGVLAARPASTRRSRARSEGARARRGARGARGALSRV